jgi:hypothetical protein
MIVVIILAVVAVVLALYMYVHNQRTKKLRAKFGPEYDRLVQTEGNRGRAEAALEQRTKRMEKVHIRALTNDERQRFTAQWRAEQALFVDNPAQAVSGADTLVQQVMHTLGYPMGDFDQRAEDVSVDHPAVVVNYRSAHAIALRDHDGKATTEDLRQAMVHYRALLEDLLGLANQTQAIHTHEVEVH